MDIDNEKRPPATGNRITYTILPTPARVGDPPSYAARVHIKPLTLRTIAKQMAREKCRYAPSEILYLMEKMMDVMIDSLRKGYAINFGSVMRLRPSIRGVFTSEEDEFDPERHELTVAVSAGPLLRDVLEGVVPRRK